MRSRGLALIAAGLLLAHTALATPTAAQDATPAAECVATTEEENKALVVEFFDAAASGNVAVFPEILAPDHIYHELSVDVPLATPQGSVEETAEWVEERRDAIVDLAVVVDPIIADGDMVAAIMSWTGTHVDTNAAVDWKASGIFLIECGMMAETWIVTDALGRLMTSGIITPEELIEITAD